MSDSPLDDLEFANNVYKSNLDLFFNPEIERRRKQNLLPNNFVLIAAQAIFFPDGKPHVVRLNSEVSVEVKLKKGTDFSSSSFWPSLNEVEHIKLNEKEFLNCGHSTLILFRDGFQLAFDFQYNKQISNEHLIVAKEFIKTSKYALDNRLSSAFIDNSFSAVELLAKTHLFLEADKNIKGRTNHKTIKSTFNKRFKASQTDFEIERREIFNKLSNLRSKARYLEGNVNIETQDLESIYQTLDRMYIELCDSIQLNQLII